MCVCVCVSATRRPHAPHPWTHPHSHAHGGCVGQQQGDDGGTAQRSSRECGRVQTSREGVQGGLWGVRDETGGVPAERRERDGRGNGRWLIERSLVVGITNNRLSTTVVVFSTSLAVYLCRGDVFYHGVSLWTDRGGVLKLLVAHGEHRCHLERWQVFRRKRRDL